MQGSRRHRRLRRLSPKQSTTNRQQLHYCKEEDTNDDQAIEPRASSYSDSSARVHGIEYERVSSRQRILDLLVFRGFSISANEYISQQLQMNNIVLSYQDAVLHLTSAFDDEGRDKKLVEYSKKNIGITNSNISFDHVVHYLS